MFCPQCGQERVSQATSFCSRCGYLLTGTAKLLENGGVPLVPFEGVAADSLRSRGVKLGLFMMLLTFVIAPILGMISVFLFGIPPWPMGVVIFLLGGGGLLRMAYAMMFESKNASLLDEGRTRSGRAGESDNATSELSGQGPKGELYPAPFMPPARTGQWLDTNDLEPTSVTDHTTKLLEKDKELTD